MSDGVAAVLVLSIALSAIFGSAAFIVWFLLRALRRSRAANAGRGSPLGFDIVGGKRPVV
jgi:hypothetical protein